MISTSALLVLLLAAGAHAQLYSFPSTPSVSVSYATALTNLTDTSGDILYNDPRVALPTNCSLPYDIGLTYGSYTSLVVSYVQGCFQLTYNGASPQPVINATATVVLTTPAGSNQTVTGWTTSYQQIYNFPVPAVSPANYPSYAVSNYTSGSIAHVNLTGLTPGATYTYVVGDPTIGQSQPLTFTVPPQTPLANRPFRLAIFADLGMTYNTSTTINNAMLENPDAALLCGDFCYADAWDPGYLAGSGNTSGIHTGTYKYPSSAPISFQPVWDYWGQLMSPLISKIPLLFVHGNHEIEYESTNSSAPGTGTAYTSWTNRYGMADPHAAAGSTSPRWWSANLNLVHVIGLSLYDDYTQGSEQYHWLVRDLTLVNRQVTPWIIVMVHNPIYNTYQDSFRAQECFRQTIEPIWYTYGVDFVYSGHVHTYERCVAASAAQHSTE
jgi:hypothetical protein